MRYCHLLFLCLLIISCNPTEKSNDQESRINVAEIKFPTTQVAVVGEAQQAVVDWEEYNLFMTAFNNYDHSAAATSRLAELAVDMRSSIVSTFNSQPIKSRLLLLETRLRRYAAFLEYSVKTEEEYVQYYQNIVEALDEFTGQLNEKIIQDQMEEELMLELQADLEEMSSTATDSIP